MFVFVLFFHVWRSINNRNITRPSSRKSFNKKTKQKQNRIRPEPEKGNDTDVTSPEMCADLKKKARRYFKFCRFLFRKQVLNKGRRKKMM